MTRIVKGAKYIFGWSVVGKDGQLAVPPEAWKEYGFKKGQKVYLLPASRTSGGFGLAASHTLRDSPLETTLREKVDLLQSNAAEGRIFTFNQRFYSWVFFKREECVQIPLNTLEAFGISPGSRLLSVRGSGKALGFLAKGPIYEEARFFPEIKVFEI